MSRYALTETAEDELREILRFIGEEHGRGRAEHVLEAFLQAFETLASSPRIGFVRPQLTGSDVRWWPVFRFLVLYEPGIEPLTVLRIVHGARDLPRIFAGE